MMLAQRIERITPSATCELEGTVSEMEASGLSIIKMNAGEPDFRTAPNIIEAAEAALAAGKTTYVAVAGIIELRRAICEKLKKDNGVQYQPNEIVVSTGAKQALMNGVLAVCNPGDEVIIPTPCWVSYVEMVKLAGGVPVLVPTKADYQLDLQAIEKAITPKTKAVMINTPNNPTGAVYTQEALRRLGELAVTHDFCVISDEVYEKLVYGAAKHWCLASFSEEIRRHSIIVNGFSKAYAMTGWRIGYSASTAEVARGITSLQGHMTSNATTFVQWAALEALTGQQESVEMMREHFAERKEYLFGRLTAIPGVRCANVDGAFYLLPDVSAYFGKRIGAQVIRDSNDFCAYLLSQARLAIVPGSAFEAPACVRIAYSNSLEAIRAGMDQMERSLAKLV